MVSNLLNYYFYRFLSDILLSVICARSLVCVIGWPIRIFLYFPGRLLKISSFETYKALSCVKKKYISLSGRSYWWDKFRRESLLEQSGKRYIIDQEEQFSKSERKPNDFVNKELKPLIAFLSDLFTDKYFCFSCPPPFFSPHLPFDP